MIDPVRVERTLARGRTTALARMTSRATVAHPTGGRTPGPDGYEVDALSPDYSGRPCRLDADEASQTQAVGTNAEEVARRLLHLPHDTRLVDGAVVRIDSGEWVGTFWRVVEATGADQKTALRVRVQQVEQPEGWGLWQSE